MVWDAYDSPDMLSYSCPRCSICLLGCWILVRPSQAIFPYVYFSKFLHVCIFGYLTIQIDCFMRSWFSRCAYVCQTVNVCVPEACRLDHFHIILFVGLTICSPPRQSGAVRFLNWVQLLPFFLLLLPSSPSSYYTLCFLRKLSLQHRLFWTPTFIVSSCYSLVLLCPPRALPPAQAFPDP